MAEYRILRDEIADRWWAARITKPAANGERGKASPVGDVTDCVRAILAKRQADDTARLDWIDTGDSSALYMHCGQWCFNGRHFGSFRDAIDAARAALAPSAGGAAEVDAREYGTPEDFARLARMNAEVDAARESVRDILDEFAPTAPAGDDARGEP